jgi:hypothetical protein
MTGPDGAFPDDAVPTAQDHANARLRCAIAERQACQYAQVLAWAEAAFGPGWLPSHRHFLVEQDAEEVARRTGERSPAAATVYTVKNAAGEQRHFAVEAGKVVEHESYEAGFGPMLLEPHPTQGFHHQGRWCPYHRYSLCWAPYDQYRPKTAEQLAARRATRERKKAAREEKRWAEDNPLLAWAAAVKAEEQPGTEEGRDRSP